MPILEMKVPSPGESISEVEIATWLVSDGNYVEKDQAIAEVDSDKATLELPAEAAGIITLAEALERDRESAYAFSLAFRSPRRAYRLLETLARWRDRIRPSPLGDQGLAISRDAFFRAGSFPDEPLFEDVVLLRRLRRRLPLRVLPVAAWTSTERFENLGIWRNLALNAALLLLHALGVPAKSLVRHYYGGEYVRRWTAAASSRELTGRRTLPEPLSE